MMTGFVHEADEGIAGVWERDAVADAGAVQSCSRSCKARRSVSRIVGCVLDLRDEGFTSPRNTPSRSRPASVSLTVEPDNNSLRAT